MLHDPEEGAPKGDLDEDGQITIDDGQQAYARVAPVVRRHTALACGALGGFFAAYNQDWTFIEEGVEAPVKFHFDGIEFNGQRSERFAVSEDGP